MTAVPALVETENPNSSSPFGSLGTSFDSSGQSAPEPVKT